MTSADIIAGKGGFQQADLMDYGSIFGMGASFGIDYTAQHAHQLGLKVKEILAQNKYHTSYSQLAKEDRASIDYLAIQKLHNLHLTEEKLVVDPIIANAIISLRSEVSTSLLKTERYTGYTKAYSLNEQTSLYTADSLIYSALVTVINRPSETYSYTNNWPYDPSVGNTATTETFMWTWISFALFVMGIGAVMFIYQQYLKPLGEHTIKLPTPLFDFKPLFASQTAVAPYFIIVAMVLLLQILSGGILAHYYTERANFYGLDLLHWLPFNYRPI